MNCPSQNHLKFNIHTGRSNIYSGGRDCCEGVYRQEVSDEKGNYEDEFFNDQITKTQLRGSRITIDVGAGGALLDSGECQKMRWMDFNMWSD